MLLGEFKILRTLASSIGGNTWLADEDTDYDILKQGTFLGHLTVDEDFMCTTWLSQNTQEYLPHSHAFQCSGCN